MLDKFTKSKLKTLSGVSLIAIIASTPNVWAQEADTEQVSEFDVIVVSTKRAKSITEVPLAISVVSGDFLREVNLNDVKDLVKVSPGFTGNSQDSFLDAIAVRGIVTNDFGNAGDPSIGIFKNGNYQGRNGSAVTSLFDVERVEVLRGPQGFLFGRNAISGAISVHTTKANVDAVEGFAELDVGERGVIVGEGAVNFPLSNNVAVRVAGYHSEENGWMKNLVNDQDLYAHNKDAARVSFKISGEALEADLMVEYEDRVQDGTMYRALGFGQGWDNLNAAANGSGAFAPPTPATANKREATFDTIGYDRGEVLSTGLQLEYQFEEMTLSSTTGYRDHTYGYGEDFDGTDVPLYYYQQEQAGKYYEQELRLASDTDDPLSWYIGASAYKEDIDTTFLGQQSENVYCGLYWGSCSYAAAYYGEIYVPSADGNINDSHRTVGKFQGVSAYLDLNYAVNDALDFNAGVRYTHDDKEFMTQTLPSDSRFAGGTGQAPGNLDPVSAKDNWDDVSWRVGANYDLSEDTFLFATISTGSKSGGYPSFVLGDDGLPNAYQPETVTSYEVGVKTTLMDGMAQLNLNAFHYNYKDLQSVYSVPGETITRIGNVGKVKSFGIEGSANITFNDFVSGRFGGSYLDSERTGVQLICTLADPNDCEGSSLVVPQWTTFAALDVHVPVEGGELGANLIYTLEQGIRNPTKMTNSGVTDMTITAGFTSDAGWSLKAYVENLFNDQGYNQLTDTDVVGRVNNSPYVSKGINLARSRTFGVRAGYKF